MIFAQRRFNPSWKITLLSLVSISFFIYLGIWQLNRAKEKETMLSQAAHLTLQEARMWQTQLPHPEQYQQIRLQGHYLPTNMLLDNQHNLHQFGYHVLTPLLVDNNSVVLIDRGWVAADVTRRQLPEIHTTEQWVNLRGQVYYPSTKTWILGQEIEKKSENLFLIERINPSLLSQLLHKSVYPFIIRLNKNNHAQYLREWPIISMPPERHKAYAAQWFAMALACFFIYFGLNFKKINENS